MEDTTPLQTDELVSLLAQRMEANRADLVNRFRQSLQETLFTNRFEMRPRDVGNIAAENAEMLISDLAAPGPGCRAWRKVMSNGVKHTNGYGSGSGNSTIHSCHI